MIEILSILIHLLIITIFFYPSKYLINFFNNNKNVNFIDKLELGAVINVFFLLIASFFWRKESNLIIYFLLIFFFFNLYSFIKDSFQLIKIKKTFFNKEFLILFILTFIFSINLSNNLKLGWDAQNYWLPKMMIFINGGDIFDLQNSPRSEYPFLGSFIWFFYTKITHLKYEYFGRIFYIYLFLLAVFSNAQLLRSNFIPKSLISILIVLLIYQADLFNGYQEIIIFSLSLILVKNFYLLISNNINFQNNIKNYKIIFILFTSLVWIKNDPLILIAIFLFSFYFVEKIKLNIKFKFIAIIILIILSKYLMFKYFNFPNVLQKGNYELLHINNLLSFLSVDRIGSIFKYLFFGLFQVVIFPISIVCLYFIKNKDLIFYNFLIRQFIISIFIIFFVFLLTSIPIDFHLYTAMSRVIFQVSSLFVISIFISYKNILK